MCLLAMCMSLLADMSIQVLCPFLNPIAWGFWIFNYTSSLHILGVKPLLDVTICNYLFSFSRLPFAAGFLHAQYLNILYHRPTDVTLTLKDPHYPDHDLGIILLSVVLTPKEGEHVVSSRRVWLQLPCSHLFECCEPSLNTEIILKRSSLRKSGRLRKPGHCWL